MTQEEERPLSDHVQVRVDQARLSRQWSNLAPRIERAGRRRSLRYVLLPAALILAAGLALLIARPWRTIGLASNIVSSATATESLVLPDGSHLALSHGAELSVRSATRERVHLMLEAGTMELDVMHVEGRPFVVTAGGHDVTVLGTAFTVKLEPRGGTRAFSVEVKRGRVRVSGPSGDHVLDAGQVWSTVVAAPGPSTVADPPAATSAIPGVTEPSPAPSSEAAELPLAPAEPPSRHAEPPIEGPKELLARATEARSAGRPREAAIALDALRKRHRTDARAGLAAFELGRLRMDTLHDPAGAAEAFADAVTLSPSAPFREDAEARRVEALDVLPDRGHCERARDAYLARYPSGLHAKRLTQRCRAP